ncbi:MAG: PAS domain S-box protein [Firmicutes bacterium]|nr:PAS domain S-box protein [Dethiobacter sp.]MBS3887985.1 PAS domain S-box protein [Bacillota bacterium]
MFAVQVMAEMWWQARKSTLSKTKESIELLAHHCSDAVVLFDASGRVAAWNEGASNVYGMTEHEAKQEVWPIYRPTERSAMLEKFRNAQQGESPTVGEEMHVQAGGDEIAVKVTWQALRGENGALMGWLMIARELSRGQQVSRELEQVNEQLSSLAVLARLFADSKNLRKTVEVAVQGLMRAVQASFCQLECTFADREDSFQTITVGSPLSEEQLRLLHAAMDEARAARRTVQAKEYVAAPVRALDRGVGVVALWFDSAASSGTRVKVVETAAQQLAAVIHTASLVHKEQQAVLRLKEIDKLRGDFVAMVSHELRTPLTCIRGFTDTLLRPDTKWPEEEEREFLLSIKTCSEQALRVVDDLLSVQQASLGKIVVVREPLSLGKLVAEACRRAQNSAHSHTIMWSVPDNLPVIRADFVRISQVLDNLLSNAIKYSPLGGEVWVRVRGMLGEVEVSVTDCGIGIAAEQQEFVFEEFYRVDNSVGRQTEGLGLGLAIVRSIVLLHGGRVWVESAIGSGSTFYFTLPASGGSQR